MKAAKLKTETNTVAMERRVTAAAMRGVPRRNGHRHLTADFEHGQWWVSCVDCGAQWSVTDQEGGGDTDGFGFEQVSNGDESCL